MSTWCRWIVRSQQTADGTARNAWQNSDQKTLLQQVENELCDREGGYREKHRRLQPELAEHLLVTGRKLSRLTWILYALLALSIGFNILVLCEWLTLCGCRPQRPLLGLSARLLGLLSCFSWNQALFK